MSETTKPMCVDCMFWDARSEEDRGTTGITQYRNCKVDGPQIGEGSIGIWPLTQGMNWCAKFRAIKPKKAPEPQVKL